MKSFITGIEGFAGHYLARHLLAQGSAVAGCYFDQSQLTGLGETCELHRLDLRDRVAASRVLDQVRPERIYHLAAQSSAARSFQEPAATFDTNIGGLISLLEAVRLAGINPRILLVSSCEVYGPVDDGFPIKETQAHQPISPYAASKAAQEIVGLQYFKSFGLQVIVARPFPHIGPGQSPVFVLPAFAKQIAEIARNRKPAVVKVGNLQARRDLSDVRDVVEAYTLLAEKGRPGEAYNVCSGNVFSIEQALNRLLALSGREIAVEVDPSRLRPNDVPVLRGDNSKIRSETGWAPRRSIDEALKALLDFWMNAIE